MRKSHLLKVNYCSCCVHHCSEMAFLLSAISTRAQPLHELYCLNNSYLSYKISIILYMLSDFLFGYGENHDDL